MPHISRSHRYNSAFVNVRVRTSDDFGDECPICMRGWCADDMCSRTMIQTNCCFQFLCANCVTKLSQICKCEDSCNNVVFICSFCRNISKTEPVALLVGNKRHCKKCKESDTRIPSPGGPGHENGDDDGGDQQ
jgi:hypothetical protein